MTTRRAGAVQKVSVLTLTGMVVGSMVGGGVFTLPGEFGEATGVLGAVIAWIIAGTGMLMLGPVFQSITALLTTTLAVQLVLVLVLFVNDALDFMLKLDTALSLVPYLLAAAYALKLTITRETYTAADEPERRKQRVIAAIAVIYSIFMLYAAGPKYLLLASIVYAPGTLLYLLARREQGLRAFNRAEAVACVVLIVAAVVGVVLLATGSSEA